MKKKAYKYVDEHVRKKIQRLKERAKILMDKGKYEEALQVIECIAACKYAANIDYVDDDLENWIAQIANEFVKTIVVAKTAKNTLNNLKIAMFYDGFGIDRRGLALIYVRALIKLDYRVVYLMPEDGENNAKGILNELNKGANIIVKIKRNKTIDRAVQIYEIIMRYMPDALFMHTLPWDTAAVMAFDVTPRKICRYMVNLTDHTFWLGVKAVDYCLEFRDYGCSISYFKRHMSKESLLVQPYYPGYVSQGEFEGFPFQKSDDDVVIFSGGALYKTISRENNNYYKLVDECLAAFPNVKFWYAGEGDNRYLVVLQKKYVGRVFYTKERGDLYQILEKCDLYINSYPISGGLMVQYAAMAGRLPLTLWHDSDSTGMLVNEDKLGVVFFKYDELKKELFRLVEDRGYRNTREKGIKEAVINADQFTENLGRILEKKESGYAVNIIGKDTSELEQVQMDKFGVYGVEQIVGSPYRKRLVMMMPIYYIYCFIVKGLCVFLNALKRCWRKYR